MEGYDNFRRVAEHNSQLFAHFVPGFDIKHTTNLCSLVQPPRSE